MSFAKAGENRSLETKERNVVCAELSHRIKRERKKENEKMLNVFAKTDKQPSKKKKERKKENCVCRKKPCDTHLRHLKTSKNE